MKFYSKSMMALVTVVASMMTQSALAAEVRCDNCTELQYEQKARTLSHGEHYVYDIPQGQVRKYWVSWESDDSGPTIVYGPVLYPSEVEAQVKDLLTELAYIYQQTGGTMKSVTIATVDGTAADITSFDVANPGAARTALVNWALYSPTSASNLAASTIAYVHSFVAAAINIFKSSEIQTFVTIILADGGKVTLKFDAAQMNITVVENSALDAAGNPIPTTALEAVGTNFDFGYSSNPGVSAAGMSDWLTRLGANVVGESASARRMSCSSSVSSDGTVTVTCHLN